MDNDEKNPSDFEGETNEDNFEEQVEGTNSSNRQTDNLDYNQLPKVLLDVCNSFDDREKLLMLMSSLTVISSALPNVFGYYNQQKIYPNLMLYVIGKAGSGKGNITWTRELISKIQTRNITQPTMSPLLQELMQGANNGLDVPMSMQIIIPANISAAGFIERLNSQNGKGLIFETEGDTIANIFKTDYGNWSDMWRKGFHHECISLYRKTDKVYINIAEPKLSVLISSTPGQLGRIVTSTENGLFSRLAFVFTEPLEEFIDVFASNGIDRKEMFEKSSNSLLQLFNFLSKLDEVNVTLSAKQRTQFVDFFNVVKSQLTNLFHEDLDASANRMGLIAFRICMILTVLRIDEGTKSNELVCSDEDFNIAIRLAEILLINANRAIEILPKQGGVSLVENKMSFFRALPSEFTKAEALAFGKNHLGSDRTVERFLDSACFERTGRGKYRKAS